MSRAASAAPAETNGVAGAGVAVVVATAVGLCALALSGVWAFWPSDAAPLHLSLVVLVSAGALGALPRALRSLALASGNRELRWRALATELGAVAFGVCAGAAIALLAEWHRPKGLFPLVAAAALAGLLGGRARSLVDPRWYSRAARSIVVRAMTLIRQKSHREPSRRGEVGVFWTLVLVLVLLALSAIALYGIWAFWPSEAARGPGLVKQKTVHFFWWDRLLSRESLFFVMVAFAGALGGMVHAIRSLAVYLGNRRLTWSWAPFYVMKPVLGAVLATVLYFVLRAGLFSPSASTEQASPYGFAAIGALTGLFSDQAVEKLRKVAEELFEKLEPQKDHYEDEPPLVKTGTGIAAGATAKLRGTVNPRGLATTYRFEYGPDVKYGTSTPDAAAGAGIEDVDAEADVDGLAAATEYHFRLVATNKGGTSVGEDSTFST